jgi:hypothetical protein
MADFTVAIVNPNDNSETVSPMKAWLRDHPDCDSAWKKDPLGGVIGVQKGPL